MNKKIKISNQTYTCEEDQFYQCKLMNSKPEEYIDVLKINGNNVLYSDIENNINASSIESFNVYFNEKKPDLMIAQSGTTKKVSTYEFHEFESNKNRSFTYDNDMQKCDGKEKCYLLVEFLYFDKKNKIVSSTLYHTTID
ncbi:MAG: hypothetical protein ACRCUP_02495 [Mycoplasmatales bacterium]